MAWMKSNLLGESLRKSKVPKKKSLLSIYSTKEIFVVSEIIGCLNDEQCVEDWKVENCTHCLEKFQQVVEKLDELRNNKDL